MTRLPVTARAHLEALLIARVLLDPAIAAAVDVDCLSPAAATLLEGAIAEPTGARFSLLSTVDPSGDPAADRFVVQLARRIEELTLLELTFFLPDSLVAHINSLPRLGLSSSSAISSDQAA